MKTLLLSAVFGCGLVCLTSAQQPAGLAGVFSTYASGDYGVAARTFGSIRGFQLWRNESTKLVASWREDRPVQAAFVLEVAAAGIDSSWPMTEVRRLFDIGRSVVKWDRPSSTAQDPKKQAFEVLWYKTSLAVLQGAMQFAEEDEFLKATERRFGNLASPRRSDSRQFDPRFALARAIAEEQRLTPAALAATGITSLTKTGLAITPNVPTKGNFAEAIKKYDAAARFAENAAEAAVRRAFLLVRDNRPREALKLLDEYGERTDDASVLYWGRLFRGRALDALDQTEAAEAAYSAALKGWPHAQTAAAALSVLSLRRGQIEAASHWAEVARTAPDSVQDPWWFYWRGDVRFLPKWLDELRRASR